MNSNHTSVREEAIYRNGAEPESNAEEIESEYDNEVCQKCQSNSYIPVNSGKSLAAEDSFVQWVCCDGCSKWYHAPCAGLSAADLANEEEWYCCK